MKKALRHGLRTWIEVDRRALEHNYKQFRKLIGSRTRLLAVAKSNAYGHSLVDYSLEMERLGVDWLGLDSIVEALTLRKEGISLPLLVLGYTLPERYAEATGARISLAISTFESLRALRGHRGELALHLKIDTGMHRQGFFPHDIPKLLVALKKLPREIRVEGVFTHLAAKDPSALRANREQLRLFDGVRGQFLGAGYTPFFHATASWGTIAYRAAEYDMVRIGMGLYGYFPSAALEKEFGKKIGLKPALHWKTILSEIKRLPEGGGVGYDLTEELPEGTILGICPIGYWHGYPRALSSKGEVLVHGKRARVVGRVSMDMIVVDLSHMHNPRVGDEVTLIGTDGSNTIDAKAIAAWAGTTHYELLTRINPLIKRIYR